MQAIPVGVSTLRSSRLAYGCWRVAGTWDPAEVTDASRAAGRRAIVTAYEAGYTLFDNADIYCRGEAERVLGEVLKEVSGMRDRVVIVTKGGIRPEGDPQPGAPGRYDFSASSAGPDSRPSKTSTYGLSTSRISSGITRRERLKSTAM